MKRVLALVLSVIMLFALCSCGEKKHEFNKEQLTDYETAAKLAISDTTFPKDSTITEINVLSSENLKSLIEKQCGKVEGWDLSTAKYIVYVKYTASTDGAYWYILDANMAVLDKVAGVDSEAIVMQAEKPAEDTIGLGGKTSQEIKEALAQALIDIEDFETAKAEELKTYSKQITDLKTKYGDLFFSELDFYELYTESPQFFKEYGRLYENKAVLEYQNNALTDTSAKAPKVLTEKQKEASRTYALTIVNLEQYQASNKAELAKIESKVAEIKNTHGDEYRTSMDYNMLRLENSVFAAGENLVYAMEAAKIEYDNSFKQQDYYYNERYKDSDGFYVYFEYGDGEDKYSVNAYTQKLEELAREHEKEKRELMLELARATVQLQKFEADNKAKLDAFDAETAPIISKYKEGDKAYLEDIDYIKIRLRNTELLDAHDAKKKAVDEVQKKVDELDAEYKEDKAEYETKEAETDLENKKAKAKDDFKKYLDTVTETVSEDEIAPDVWVKICEAATTYIDGLKKEYKPKSSYSSSSSYSSGKNYSSGSYSGSYGASDADTNKDGYVSGNEFQSMVDKYMTDHGY